MDVAKLRKIYANKNDRKQEQRRASLVRKRVDSTNWTYAGRSISINKTPRSPLSKSNSARLAQNQQFAKSYGHGGFFRKNIMNNVEDSVSGGIK